MTCWYSKAQDSTLLLPFSVVNGDTIYQYDIKPVFITSEKEFRTNRELERYRKLIANIKKTLPYAKECTHRLDIINSDLEKLSSRKEREEYLDNAEKKLFIDFEADIREMTITQGRVLMKLIDRETGKSSYSLIKEYKGSVTAVFWQGIARIFGSNLKITYKPDSDDKIIEEIIIKIENGQL
jgi:hypothetical protein